MTDVVPWQLAWQEALYGPDGFFTTGAGPGAHFRTAVHAAPGLTAAALARLAREHGCTRVLDVGAGRGELLRALAADPVGSELGLHGVDVVDRPPDLPAVIGWSRGVPGTPDEAYDGALVVAWELLDDVPCPVLELDDDGVPCTVLVQPATGREELGDPAGEADRAWCRRWWPPEDFAPGDRIEVGRPRDELWGHLVSRAVATRRGALLLAVDYGHERADRPPGGSLVGYRGGRTVPPVPDGSCNLTAHVALDAVAAAGEAAGASSTRRTDQRTALRELGVGAVPSAQPAGGGELLRRLTERSAAAELLDPGSLGGFGWLLQRAGG